MEVKRPIIAAVLLQLNASEGDRLLSPTEIKSDAEDATNFIDGEVVTKRVCWHNMLSRAKMTDAKQCAKVGVRRTSSPAKRSQRKKRAMLLIPTWHAPLQNPFICKA